MFGVFQIFLIFVGVRLTSAKECKTHNIVYDSHNWVYCSGDCCNILYDDPCCYYKTTNILLPELNCTYYALNDTTQLEEMLLAKLPDLQAYTKGRKVLLVFEKDVGQTIALACTYNNTIHIGKTAEIIRAQIKEYKTKFSGSVFAEKIHSSVSPSLLELVCMIEHGPDIQSQSDNCECKSDLVIAQLIKDNYHAKTPKVSEQQRHAVDREPHFCIYIGLLIFARTRKRQLIDTLFQYGLCISYHRVLEISTQQGEAVVDRFLSEGLVCPSL
ncbi:unnamed protein product [Mytilus coruscus]|uniref:Uncharacterized protein n=1 Tax=Mytilus coruscus TaxID=42192 RepID=A0A6J8F5B5_MYTCO|nr:unnamed protein product [Mytilus coruscus]